MTLRHAYVAAGTNDATKEVSVDRWNQDHFVDSGGILMTAGTTDPAAPAAGNILLYAKTIAGKGMPKWIGSSGIDLPFQAHIGFNNLRRVSPANGTTTTTHATAISTAYTSTANAFTIPAIATGSLLSRTRRWTQATNTTAGNAATHRTSTAECSRETGFFFVTRFYILTLAATNRAFFGLTTSSAVATNIDPLAATNITIGHLGMAINTSTGNWKLTRNIPNTPSTNIDLGVNFPVNVTNLMELVLFASPNDTSLVNYRITNLTSGSTVSGTISTGLMTAQTSLAVQHWISNGSTAATAAFGCAGWSLETDY
jgi:hypothetical protein